MGSFPILDDRDTVEVSWISLEYQTQLLLSFYRYGIFKTWSALNAHLTWGVRITMPSIWRPLVHHGTSWTHLILNFNIQCSSPSTTENFPTSYFCSTIFQDPIGSNLNWPIGSTGTPVQVLMKHLHSLSSMSFFESVKVTGSEIQPPMIKCVRWMCHENVEVLGGSILQSISPLASNQHTCLNFATPKNLLCQTNEQKWSMFRSSHMVFASETVTNESVLSLLRRVRATQTIARTAWREVSVS